MTNAIDTEKLSSPDAHKEAHKEANKEAHKIEIIRKPGEMIRAQREAAGITHAAVSAALHLTVHYVKALENDEYSKLPGLTFVKGYFRAYARFLRMDVDEVLACYERYLKEQGLQTTEQEQNCRIRKRNDQVVLWAVVAGLILVAAVFAGWWFFGRGGEETTATIRPPVNTAVEVARPAPAVVTPPPVAAGLQTGTAVTGSTVAPLNATQFQPVPAATGIVTDPAATAAAPGNVAAPTSALADEPSSAAAVAVDATSQAAPVTAPATAPVTEPAFEPAFEPEVLPETAPAPAVPAPVPATDPDAAGAAVDDGAAAETTPNQVIEGNATFIRNPDGSRHVELSGLGDDSLRMNFSGTSWVEVDDPARKRLYSDLMRTGDELIIQGGAPFHILLGDATQVKIQFNSELVDINSGIRTDKTARMVIDDAGMTQWVVR